jgi:hypothetical protein
VIYVYTINKRFGEPIEKREAEKITGKTVTFANGSRENLENDYRAHFSTLDAAVEYFEFFQGRKRSWLESELKNLDERGDAFFDFVWKERGLSK